MKRVVPVAAMCFILLAACKKDRTCTCTVPANGSITEQKYTYTIKDSKKSKAKNACKAADEYYSLSAGSCKLD